MNILNGKKTILAAVGLGLLGIVDILNGDTPAGVEKIVGALALVGIGHKIDKSAAK